ncbi:hypothetical protein PLICRDRAFT_32827 [Plicaturopsis crispa FD-325 SS-3]|uniref:UbiA prenyltransferase n=1 Tax=Plicaturopsis crispa FD-325 SS-3 TaxID=944288 RepID=A0A0C9T692_PLICR|nr:hypothetical protein PLICRDRAFT_32827 [Plicaturopsis crispa FD-325 SS-3]
MALNLVRSAVSALSYHAVTLFLFTKSDIKTTLIPISILSAVSAPSCSLSSTAHAVFWIWLHLLQFDVSNQTLDPEEDKNNKKDRPLPSGRITFRNAIIFRWALVPICFALSLCYSAQVFYASVALVFFTILYDECHCHAGHWAVRNFVNACGFASFEYGSTLIARCDRTSLDGAGIISVVCSFGIFLTTIQAQDFKDTEGDRLIGRQTLPLVVPSIARYTVISGLLCWSIGLSFLWQLDIMTSLCFHALALLVGVRFLKYKTIPQDQVSFYLYNVWLSAAHALPGYWRSYVAV